MSGQSNKPPKPRWHEVRFNPTPQLKKPAVPTTSKLAGGKATAKTNVASNSSAPASSAAPSSSAPSAPSVSVPGSNVNPATPTLPGSNATPAIPAPVPTPPNPPIQALVPQPSAKLLALQQATVAAIYARPVPKKKRLWQVYLIGLPVLLLSLLAGLFLWETTRNFMFNFFALSATEARYLSEITQLNNRLDTTLNRAYPLLLDSTPRQQEQGYKLLYTDLGEISARFLATESPSFRFNRAHQQLQQSYIQFELLSKKALLDFNQNIKNTNQPAFLANLDEVRKNFERAKRELKSAANF